MPTSGAFFGELLGGTPRRTLLQGSPRAVMGALFAGSLLGLTLGAVAVLHCELHSTSTASLAALNLHISSVVRQQSTSKSPGALGVQKCLWTLRCLRVRLAFTLTLCGQLFICLGELTGLSLFQVLVRHRLAKFDQRRATLDFLGVELNIMYVEEPLILDSTAHCKECNLEIVYQQVQVMIYCLPSLSSHSVQSVSCSVHVSARYLVCDMSVAKPAQ